MSGEALELERVAPTERDTARFGECLAAGLPGGAAVVVAIDGELGAGKTCLVRGLAAGLGIDAASISSPTFVLSMEHAGEGGARLVHMDAWRLGRERGGPVAEELESLGWSDLLASPGAVIAIEWASRIAEALPDRRVSVTIDPIDGGSRRIALRDTRDRESQQRLANAIAMYAASDPADARRCPTCGGAVASDAEAFPFCSSRCRMADLGRWFTGRYRIG